MSTSHLSTTERVAYARLWWAGVLTVVLSVTANAVIRTIARAAFDVPDEFPPFTWGQFTFLTVAGVAGATITFAIIGRLSRRPVRAFTGVAVIALILSWLPDIGLLAARPYPGTSVQSVGTLMFMHLVTAAITVGLLTRLGVKRKLL